MGTADFLFHLSIVLQTTASRLWPPIQKSRLSRCRPLVARKLLLPWLIVNEDKASSVLTASPLNKLSPSLSNSSSKNQFCYWERTDSPKSTLEFVLRVVDVLPKSTPSDRHCPRHLWPIIRNLSMNNPRRPSRIFLSNMTEHS